ncbi:hypothetical protein [Streptomyces sp. NPDC001205]
MRDEEVGEAELLLEALQPKSTSRNSGNLAPERSRIAWRNTEWSIKQAFFSEGLTPTEANIWSPGECTVKLTYLPENRAKLTRSLANLVKDGWTPVPDTPSNTQFTKGDLRLSVSAEHDVSEPGSPVQANTPLKYVSLDVTSASCADAAGPSR